MAEEKTIEGIVSTLKLKEDTEKKKCGLIKLNDSDTAYFFNNDEVITGPGIKGGDAVKLTVNKTWVNKAEKIPGVAGTQMNVSGDPEHAPPRKNGSSDFAKEAQWRTPDQLMRTSAVEVAAEIAAAGMIPPSDKGSNFWNLCDEITEYIRSGVSPELAPSKKEKKAK